MAERFSMNVERDQPEPDLKNVAALKQDSTQAKLAQRMPAGVIICGIVILLYSLWLLDSFLIFKPLDPSTIKMTYQTNNFLLKIYPFHLTNVLLKFGLATLFISVAYLISSITILKRNNQGRIFAVYLSYVILGLIILVGIPVVIKAFKSGFSQTPLSAADFYWSWGFSLYAAAALFPAFLVLVFLTRPEVKARFDLPKKAV